MAGALDDTRLVTLMKAAQAGDSAAYEDLLEDLVPRVRRFVRGQPRLLPTEQVDDVVQEILLSMHLARATYDSTRPFLPWLFAIARNRLTDSVRRNARRNAHEVHDDEIDVTFSCEAPKIPNEGDPDYRALKEAIRALPSRQRRAIQLLKLQDMSLREAAAASGTSIGALKVATHRAMSTLKKMLKV